MSIVLELKNVNKSFGEKQVLKDVNLQIGCGKIVGLLGKNGSGRQSVHLILRIPFCRAVLNTTIPLRGAIWATKSRK